MSAAHCWLVSRVPSSWYLFGNYTRVYMCSCLSISITLRRETNSAEANSPNHARVQQGRCGCNASVCCRCQYRVRMSKGGGLEREGEGRTHRETEFRGGSRPKWQLRLPIPLSDEAGASGGSRWPLQFCRGRLRGLGATRGRGPGVGVAAHDGQGVETAADGAADVVRLGAGAVALRLTLRPGRGATAALYRRENGRLHAPTHSPGRAFRGPARGASDGRSAE